MSMETRASQVEDFVCQQDLLVAVTHIKLINNVRVAASGGVRILDVLRHVKRERLLNLMRAPLLPILSLCHFLKVLGCLFEQLEH